MSTSSDSPLWKPQKTSTRHQSSLLNPSTSSRALFSGSHEAITESFSVCGARIQERGVGSSLETVSRIDDSNCMLLVTMRSMEHLYFLAESVNRELRNATKYPRNGQQADMLNTIIKSFETGSLQLHKQASQIWIKDKLPIVERLSTLRFIG